MKDSKNPPIQPVSGTIVPRFAGPSTFARLPEIRDVNSCDIAILGIPFDAGTSYRPGARFGPQAIRHRLPDTFVLTTTPLMTQNHSLSSK
tara:strand:+ start:202 stop:471 length:270 start_codon:yes stop_codon:yes gene_type:complete